MLRQFERPNFFTGKLLTLDDLQREQAYHRDKARLRNRFLYGWGVITGLRVRLDDGMVVVAPGLALDCAGNELVLPTEARVSLFGWKDLVYVTIGYVELPIGQAPTPGGDLEPSIIREAVTVAVSATNPLSKHGALRPGDSGCGQDHALCVAVGKLRGSRWRITPYKAALPYCRR